MFRLVHNKTLNYQQYIKKYYIFFISTVSIENRKLYFWFVKIFARTKFICVGSYLLIGLDKTFVMLDVLSL